MKERLEINKTAVTVILLNVFQVSSILGIIGYSIVVDHISILSSEFRGIHLLLALVILNVIYNGFVVLRTRDDLIRSGIRYNQIKDALEQVEKLNLTLRSQRHDFLNHLQVVYSLIEMEEFEEARDYIDKVYNDIQKVGKALKTAIPAVNALLQAKLMTCEKKNISASLDASTQLEELKVPSWEFCRVLGNIVDNAINALEEKDSDRRLDIELFEDIKSYGFRVKNNGAAIPLNLQQKIFEAGFTTRPQKGEGMGLAITQKILNKHGGNINVESSEDITVFEVRFSK